jgi:type I restriction enzyme S subunit
LDLDAYISTENMLPNKEGITRSAGLPTVNLTQAYKVGDVLVSNIRPYFRKIWFADRDGGCSNDVLVLRAKEICDPGFLYYLLSDNNFFDYATATGKGTKMPRGDKNAIMRYTVPDVPLDTQIEIVSSLSAFDSRIAINKKINHRLEQITQAIFKSWFVDFDSKKPFTEIVRVLGGDTPKIGNSNYWGGSIPFFTPKDALSTYVLKTQKTLTEEGIGNCNCVVFKENTVFVTARGTVGKLAFAGRPMGMNQSCYALIGKEGFGQYFVYHLTQTVMNSLKRKASGAVFDALVTRDFENEVVAVPSNDKINLFEEQIAPFYTAILQNSFENIRLEELRDTLLPRLMSGELSVTDIEDMQ